MKKKLLALLLACCMVFGMLPAVSAAETGSGTLEDGMTWSLDSSGTLTISGTGPMMDFDDWDDVPWYQYATSITKVVVKPGITTIGARAISEYDRLTSVSLPEGITSIGTQGISNNRSLTTITLPKSLESIGSYAFFGNTSLTTLEIPESVTSIGSRAFSNCESLLRIAIPEGITEIGEHVLSWCKSLVEVDLPDSLTTIGSHAFMSCYQLKSVTIPNGVTTIGESAFSQCSNLTEVEIPEGVTSIGPSAFYHCEKLVTVSLPSTLESIGDQAFNLCSSLIAFQVDENNPNFANDDAGALYNKDYTTLYQIPGAAASFTIPSTVTNINYSAFWGCANLTAITIPNSVTAIGDWAFSDCDSLTEVVIPDSVTELGQYAFAYCDLLENVTLPENLTALNYRAFRECPALTGITFPDSIQTIGGASFEGCTSLTELTIPASVTFIDSYAFADCSSLSEVHFLGDAPAFGEYKVFGSVTATCYYPAGSSTWNADKLQQYGGTITWVAEGEAPEPTEPTIPEDHTHTEELRGAHDPDCIYAGYTGDVYCSVCGILIREGEVIPSPGHSYGNWVIEEYPAEEHNGLKTQTCTACGDSHQSGVSYPEDDHPNGNPVNVTSNVDNSFRQMIYKADPGHQVVIEITSPRGTYLADIRYASSQGVSVEAPLTFVDNTYIIFTMPEGPLNVDLVFDYYPGSNVNLFPGEGGSLSAEYETAYEGESFFVQAIPAEGYILESLNVVSHGTYDAVLEPWSENNYRVTMPDGAIDIYATFVPAPLYTITVVASNGGTASVDVTQANRGDRVILTVQPDPGYELDQIYAYTDGTYAVSGGEIGYNTFEFYIPDGNVIIKVQFLIASNPFQDLKETDYFYTPVLWAVTNEITSGVSANRFGPNNACTRAQVVTFLWAAAGRPEPTSYHNPFTDVKETDYYYKAVLWAVENGITSGMSATTFGSNNPCTRAQVVTFLWAAAGKPEPSSYYNPFTDVKESDYFYKAVLWAVENGITSGMDETTFGSNRPCTRAQVVTFLWAAVGRPEPSGGYNPFTDVKETDYYYKAVLFAMEYGITSGMSSTTFGSNSTCTRAHVVTFLYRTFWG